MLERTLLNRSSDLRVVKSGFKRTQQIKNLKYRAILKRAIQVTLWPSALNSLTFTTLSRAACQECSFFKLVFLNAHGFTIRILSIGKKLLPLCKLKQTLNSAINKTAIQKKQW